jgi:hypothetical protein
VRVAEARQAVDDADRLRKRLQFFSGYVASTPADAERDDLLRATTIAGRGHERAAH